MRSCNPAMDSGGGQSEEIVAELLELERTLSV